MKTNSLAQKLRNIKEVVFKSVACMMLPVLSDIYKTWKLLFIFSEVQLIKFTRGPGIGAVVSRPVG